MLMTLHCQENEVKIEIGILPEFDGADDLKDKIEIAIIAKDKTFSFVSYVTRQELVDLIDKSEDILDELDRQDAEKELKIRSN